MSAAYELDPRVKRAFDTVLQRLGVPSQLAERALREIHGEVVTILEGDRTAGAAEAQRNTEFNTDLLRQRWGSDFDKKMDAVRKALELVDDATLDRMLEGKPAANVAERLATLGERMSATTPQPAPATPPTASATKPGDSKVQNPAKLVRDLENQLGELHDDPKFLQRFTDPRHPRHQAAVEERQALISRLAAAQAVMRGEKPGGLSPDVAGLAPAQAAEKLRVQLAKLEGDAQWMREFSDQAHFRHRQRVNERTTLLRQIHEAETLARSRGVTKSAAEIRREIEELRHDPKFSRAIDAGAPTWRNTDPEYQAAIARHQELGLDLAAAERREASAATHAVAAGDASATD